MRKSIWSVLLSAALVASAFTTVGKADPLEAPAVPNIVDDQGDAADQKNALVQKKKKKKPRPCAAYEPGELGAEVEEETTVVTDEATEEEPIEVPVATGPGLGFTSTDPEGGTGAASHVYHNIQVDPKAKTTGLYVRVEYALTWDYDIFLRLADGTAVAYEADFNPVPGTPLGGMENGHAEQGAGQIDGYESADCDGFTMDIASAITPGGEVTMTLWLGEPGGGEEEDG